MTTSGLQRAHGGPGELDGEQAVGERGKFFVEGQLELSIDRSGAIMKKKQCGTSRSRGSACSCAWISRASQGDKVKTTHGSVRLSNHPVSG